MEVDSVHRETAADVRAETARRWISFALGLIAKRSDNVLEIQPPLVRHIRDELAAHVGEAGAGQIDAAVGGLGQFLIRDFYPWHLRLYAKRPIYWGFRGAKGAVLVHHERASAETMKRVIGSVPAGWERFVDDGLPVNLAPLIDSVADPALRAALKPVAEDLSAGKLAWSQTARRLNRGSTGGCDRARTRRRPTSVA
jgi:hypothetical protein